ncbi:MAG: type II toxin-antitoxin system PemK/MazF family toxin [Bacteroidota bacterium]|nr:type II toxin-antitoxin system PemK/MazF family toxin [Bacteroidota bacterium]
MNVNQRDIVEVNFQLPGGKSKVHPALVVSNQSVLETEDIFYALMISSKEYNDDFSFELKNSMLTKPLNKVSYVKCQLLQSYSPDEVISKISSIKLQFFEQIKKIMFETVF